MCKIQGLFKVYPNVFKDSKFMKNTDLPIKIIFANGRLISFQKKLGQR